MRKKIHVVGAGPGGLTAAMLLAAKGHEVHVWEKESVVGGRNAPLTAGAYTFDTGPTFLMMTDLLDQVFAEAGRKTSDYLELKRLDPLYRLRFKGGVDFYPRAGLEDMLAEIGRAFPEDVAGYRRFREMETKKLEVVKPCLSVPYDHLWHYLRPRLLKALPRLDAWDSVYDRVASYFSSEYLRLSMTFQAKYLGMSPWHCPATFTILPLIEQVSGLYHVTGGLSAISKAMARVVEELGGQVHLGTPVEKVLMEGKRAVGVRLAGGLEERGDALVVNADFAYAMSDLVDDAVRSRYKDEKLRRMEYSCSTFMLYLGVRKKYDIPHHNVIFSDDYKTNLRDITVDKRLSEDPSFYIQNASVTDPTLAPSGSSAIYILVPVPNRTAAIDWEREKAPFRRRVLDAVMRKTELKDLEAQIEEERIITPLDWERQYHVYNGATFNLAHTIRQMLYFRPHNRFEDLEGCYLVGGGTHPGSGLPTIYMSGKITADLIAENLG